MWNDFPRAGDLNRTCFEREMLKGPVPRQYTMFFTPRSGSSWVTDVVTRAKRIGIPCEYFNPDMMHRVATTLNATTIEEFRDILIRRCITNGVFGQQITYHQMRAVFGNADRFVELFPQDKCFWLIREDIVLQGISLYKMQHTKIAHAPEASDEERHKREDLFVYDAKEIKRWIRHIRVAETGSEALFEKFGMNPFRMSYERNTQLSPQRLVNIMERHLSAPKDQNLKIESIHKKIVTDANLAFADRFREQNRDFVAELEEERHPMIEKVRSIGDASNSEETASDRITVDGKPLKSPSPRASGSTTIRRTGDHHQRRTGGSQDYIRRTARGPARGDERRTARPQFRRVAAADQ